VQGSVQSSHLQGNIDQAPIIYDGAFLTRKLSKPSIQPAYHHTRPDVMTLMETLTINTINCYELTKKLKNELQGFTLTRRKLSP
jgi:hypothetical protein